MKYTTVANIVADDVWGYQISKTNESGIAPLSNNVIWKEEGITGDAAAADISQPTVFFKEFSTPIKLHATEILYVGAIMPDAGFCEVKLLVSEVDVTH